MKKLILILLAALILLAPSCYDNNGTENDLPLMPGMIYVDLQPNTNFINAAYLVTDTFSQSIAYTANLDYGYEGTSAQFKLDSILGSKPYVSDGYTILTVGTSAETKDLQFEQMTKPYVIDWDTTVTNYNLVQKTSVSSLIRLYVNVPSGEEEDYIAKYKDYNNIVYEAGRVYGYAKK